MHCGLYQKKRMVSVLKSSHFSLTPGMNLAGFPFFSFCLLIPGAGELLAEYNRSASVRPSVLSSRWRQA